MRFPLRRIGSSCRDGIIDHWLPRPRKRLAPQSKNGSPETVYEFKTGPMPTGVTVAKGGRIFVNFPRWGDDVPFTVGEIN